MTRATAITGVVVIAVLGVGACTSKSAASANAADDSGAADCSNKEVAHFDGARCSRSTVVGLCTRSLGYDSATQETACAAGPDGGMYLITVDGDTYLSGAGWSFGPREFGPDGEHLYPVEPNSLSASDAERCNAAQLACNPFNKSPADAGGSSSEAGP